MSLSTPIAVRHKDHDMEGMMVSMDIISTPMKDPTTNEIAMSHEVMCGVCWNDARTPAISMHPSTDLEWVDIPGFTGEDEEDPDFLEEGEEEAGEQSVAGEEGN